MHQNARNGWQFFWAGSDAVRSHAWGWDGGDWQVGDDAVISGLEIGSDGIGGG